MSQDHSSRWLFIMGNSHELQKLVLNQLHTGNLGIVRMKSLVQLHVCWPNLHKDISTVIQQCEDCQGSRNKLQQAPLHPWDWSKMPWQRIHVDFAGPFMGKRCSIVIVMHCITSETTIKKLREMFARYGIPQQLITVPTSLQEFSELAKANGI